MRVSTEKIGAWIKRERLKQEMTVSELSAKVGIEGRTLQYIEKGIGKKESTIQKLLNALGFEVSYSIKEKSK